MLPSNRFETRSHPSKWHLWPWRCSLPLFPDLLTSGSQSGLLARALVRVLQLCVGARLTLNTDLPRSRPCIASPPIDFVGELSFGPVSSGATSGDPKQQRLRRLKSTQVVRDDPGHTISGGLARGGWLGPP